MKVLLLGGTGVLSTEICKEAIAQGHEVYTVTRGRRVNLLSDKAHNLFADIYNETELRSVLEDMEFDVVVDFLVRYAEDLERTLRVLKNRCKQFVLISTATVYEPSSQIISEKHVIGNQAWDYARYKEQSELLLQKEWMNYVETYTIVRPYVTYGKTRIPSAIVPIEQWSLLNRIINEKPIPLWDGGKALINITHAKDFAKGFVGLFQNEKAFNQDFHITSQEEITWEVITELVAKSVGKKLFAVDIPTEYMAEELPEFADALKHDKSHKWIFDNAKIKEAVPQLSFDIAFEDGIKDTIDYYMENEKARVVNYIWEGKIDRMIRRYCKRYGVVSDFEQLSLRANKEKLSVSDKCLYWIGRYEKLTKLYCFLIRIDRFCRRMLKRII